MKRRMLSMLLIFALAVTMPSATSEAAKTTTKKMAINKKKATLDVGGTLKLKVNNLKKGQKVKWSSNKKKIAAVTSKGKVTAKKAGKTVITAKVGKKKLKCTVTVRDKKSNTPKPDAQKTVAPKPTADTSAIASVSSLNAYTLSVTFSKEQSLQASNFTVKAKKYSAGTYNHVLDIAGVSTSDKKTYMISLDEDGDALEENLYVQVTVTGLAGAGTATKEITCSMGKAAYEQYAIYTAVQGAALQKNYYLSGVDLYGWNNLSVTGLPDGLKYRLVSYRDYEDGLIRYISFTGIPEKAGTFQSKIVVTDELSNTVTVNLTWLVGSDTSIAAACDPVYGIAGKHGYYLEERIQVVGGSGSYLYEIQGESQGLSVYNGEIYGTLTKSGDYSVTIAVKDKNDLSKTTTVNLQISLKDGVTVSGVVKDLDGAVESDAEVCFNNKNSTDPYSPVVYATTNSKGEYSVVLVDGIYDAVASSEYVAVKKRLYSINVNAEQSGVDFVIPVRTVTVNFDKSVGTWTEGWYDADTDDWYGSGTSLKLKTGSYNLISNMSKGYIDYVATLQFTMDTTVTTVTATVTEQSYLVGDIAAEEPVNVVTRGGSSNSVYYKFVAPETKTYYFYTQGDNDTVGRLCSASGTELAYNDDIYADGQYEANFLMAYDCNEGQTYYVAVATFDSGSPYTTLYVSEECPYDEWEDDEDW